MSAHPIDWMVEPGGRREAWIAEPDARRGPERRHRPGSSAGRADARIYHFRSFADRRRNTDAGVDHAEDSPWSRRALRPAAPAEPVAYSPPPALTHARALPPRPTEPRG